MASDDWFMEFINQFKPWIGRANSDQIGTALDYLMGGQAGRNEWKWNVASLPIIGDYYKWQDANNFWQDYFQNRGLDWSQAQYPTMMLGAGSGANAVMHGADTVLGKSKTLGRLYEGFGQDFGDWEPVRPYSLPPGGRSFRTGRTTRYFYRGCPKQGHGGVAPLNSLGFTFTQKLMEPMIARIL